MLRRETEDGMFHDPMPAHVNELLLLQKEVGTVLATSSQISTRVWGLHLLEDWKSLKLWAERLNETDSDRITVR